MNTINNLTWPNLISPYRFYPNLSQLEPNISGLKSDPILHEPEPIWSEVDPYLPFSSPWLMSCPGLWAMNNSSHKWPHFTINLSRLDPKWPENDPFVYPNRWPLPFSYQIFSIVIGWSENWMICIWPMR